MLVRDHLCAAREAEANRRLSELYSESLENSTRRIGQGFGSLDGTVDEDAEARLRAEEEEKKVRETLSNLAEMNPDIAGWLRMDGIGVDLPVMYTQNDQDYYIRRGFDKKYAQSGSLFIAVPWGEESRNTIIYGHHMNDHTMFGDLNCYSSEEFGLANRDISFNTVYGRGNYELVGAFYSEIYPISDTTHFHYYEYADITDRESFEYYVEQVKAAALYDTGVEPIWGDSLLTLSTCEYHKKNGRFVVVARKKLALQ